MKRAAYYVRYSSDNQREESIEAQIRAINEYVSNTDCTMFKIYADEAMSAKTDNRPQFMQMISDAKRGLFDVVICHKLDRFARNRYDSAIYKKILRDNGIKLISVLENFDDSPESIILESVLEGMNEYYSANLAREVKKGLKENALQCRHTGGKPPLGYDVVDKEYVVNEHEAKAIRQIFDMTVAGQSYLAVRNWLKENGYKTKYNTEFTSRAINEILKNEKYIGVYVYNQYKRIVVDGKKQNVKNPDDEVIRIENGIAALIDYDTFKKANEILEERKHRSFGSSTAKEIYLLSGKMYCGECGGSMNGARFTGGSNKHRYVVYECANRKRKTCDCKKKDINRDTAEDITITILERELFSDEAKTEFIDKLYAFSETLRGSIPEDIKKFESELQGINRQIDNIISAIASGMFHESMKSKMDDLESRKAILIGHIAEAKRQLEAYVAPSRDKISEYLEQFTKLKNKSPEQKRAAIETFIKKVVVYDDSIDIYIDYTIIHGAEPYSLVVKSKI